MQQSLGIQEQYWGWRSRHIIIREIRTPATDIQNHPRFKDQGESISSMKAITISINNEFRVQVDKEARN